HQDTPFIPTEIRVMTTAMGKERVQSRLIDVPRINQLYRDHGYGDALPLFDSSCVHVPGNEQGQPLDDIRSAEDNAIMADDILRLACELTADDDCAVHASIAGGRKT